MNNEFVNYEQALALKELGFNEDCFGYYENQNEHLVIIYNNSPLTEEQNKRPGLYVIDNKNSSLPQWATSAPLKQQVFRWFHKNHNLYSWVEKISIWNEYFYVINPHNLDDYKQGEKYSFKTPEETESALIDKLIEIVKNKSN